MESSDITQPGPQQIEPRSCPGGVVIHVYGVPSGKLLSESTGDSLQWAAFRAGADHDVAAANLPTTDEGFCLVAFDGDSGRRFTQDEWLSGGIHE